MAGGRRHWANPKDRGTPLGLALQTPRFKELNGDESKTGKPETALFSGHFRIKLGHFVLMWKPKCSANELPDRARNGSPKRVGSWARH
jgi:hypothetical protein